MKSVFKLVKNNSHTMLREHLYRLSAFIFVALMAMPGLVLADEAPDAGVCAQVKIQILQQATFERIAFDAVMTVTNDMPTDGLENFRVDVIINDMEENPADQLFFTRIESLDNISAVDGTGYIPSGVRAEMHWLIIPSAEAGGDSEQGRDYMVGASVNYTINGVPKDMAVIPDDIHVKPQPKLYLDYFMPTEVIGDDPFTLDAIEESEPFTLGVRVENQGYGHAYNLKIESGQVEIIENEKGLLIGFRILGSTVNGEAYQPTLTVEFGDIDPMECGTARWYLISTLMGEFIDFDVEFSHSDELGGALTSLIMEANAHFLTHNMLVDLPGRDQILDFLADSDRDEENLPDMIYESNCQEHPVNWVNGGTDRYPSTGDPSSDLNTDYIGSWVYTKVWDPSQGNLDLVSVVRSDGKMIKVPENAWQTSRIRHLLSGDVEENFIHLVDFNTTTQYTLIFSPPPADYNPPTTQLIFQEPNYGVNPTYITSATQIIFYADDDISGVANVLYSLDGAPFAPAYPFWIPDEGPHTIEFYAVDREGNTEDTHLVTVVVDNNPPVISDFLPNPANFVPGAPPGGDPRELYFDVVAQDFYQPELNLTIEIAKGYAADNNEFSNLMLETTLSQRTNTVSSVIVWDGMVSDTAFISEGHYMARLTVSDMLGQSVNMLADFNVVELIEFIAADATGADQKYPDLYGEVLTWQDDRNANWDIYMYNTTSQVTVQVTSESATQERPATDGSFIVWQDRRSGDYDIYYYDVLTTMTNIVIDRDGDQKNPVIDYPWVVFQDRFTNNWDIYAYNLETYEEIQITSDALDQINPSIDGDTIVWQDYRNGLGEIFMYDLVTRTETQLTDELHNQTHPDVSGNMIVWVDERDENREIYAYAIDTNTTTRLTSTTYDEEQPRLDGDNLIMVDYSAGLSDSGLKLMNVPNQLSTHLLFSDARQEEPTIYQGRFAWQDLRDGHWQIYYAEGGPPVAVATADQLVAVNTSVVLDGTGSYSYTGNPLTYSWDLLTKPTGSTAVLNNANQDTADFVPDKTGTYVISLVVNDTVLNSGPDLLSLTAVLQGDVNNNEVLDLNDVLVVLELNTGQNPSSTVNIHSDVDEDGHVSSAEGVYVLEQLGLRRLFSWRR